MLTPRVRPLVIAYNTGAGGRVLHTICIVRKYFAIARVQNRLSYRDLTQHAGYFMIEVVA